jgi:hypothetical protein
MRMCVKRDLAVVLVFEGLDCNLLAPEGLLLRLVAWRHVVCRCLWPQFYDTERLITRLSVLRFTHRVFTAKKQPQTGRVCFVCVT